MITVEVMPILDGEYIVRIDADTIGSGTWIAIDLPFRKGSIVRHKATLVTGVASRIDTIVARAPEVSERSTLVEFRASPLGSTVSPRLDTVIDVQPTDPVIFYAAADVDGYPSLDTGIGRLFFAAMLDRGANNCVQVEMILRAEWPR